MLEFHQITKDLNKIVAEKIMIYIYIHVTL